MTEVNGRESTEIQGHDVLDTIRTLIRLAPILAVVLALSACGKKADDPELQACRIETARIEGILKGVGIDNDQSPTDTIQACLVAKARIEGIMRGAAMKDKEVKVQLDAMGVKLGFDLPGGKAHPGLSEEGDADTVKKVTPATPEEIALKTAKDKLERAKVEEKTRAVESEIARMGRERINEEKAAKEKEESERKERARVESEKELEVVKRMWEQYYLKYRNKTDSPAAVQYRDQIIARQLAAQADYKKAISPATPAPSGDGSTPPPIKPKRRVYGN